MQIGLFLFRRDFRYEDNTSLIELSKKVQIIYPVFNYDPIQADPKINKWFSEKAFRFMQESILDLDPPLIIMKNDIIETLQICKKKYNFTWLGFNLDYTEFSIARDKKIMEWCKESNIEIIAKDDIKLLPNPPLTTQMKNYRIFTPFYNKCMAKMHDINADIVNVRHMIYVQPKKQKKIYIKKNPGIPKGEITKGEIIKSGIMKGGRQHALKLLDNASNADGDIGMIGINMSPYLKFGCVSIREVYTKFKNNDYVIRQLLWRDFYYGLELTKEYSKKLIMREDAHLFNLWARGETGCAIVDAGMRQLNQTGTMPNRIRLIVASYLVKDLQLDWQLGEHYFATKLIDYDPLINNGNWAWIAGINNRSSQRPMIKFNPETQQKKYDPDMKYIKEWT